MVMVRDYTSNVSSRQSTQHNMQIKLSCQSIMTLLCKVAVKNTMAGAYAKISGKMNNTKIDTKTKQGTLSACWLACSGA